MRLSSAQTRVFPHCVREQLGADASVMLFGSRLHDDARGADVDLLVESAAPATLRQRVWVTMALEKALALPAAGHSHWGPQFEHHFPDSRA